MEEETDLSEDDTLSPIHHGLPNSSSKNSGIITEPKRYVSKYIKLCVRSVPVSPKDCVSPQDYVSPAFSMSKMPKIFMIVPLILC